MPHLEDWQAVLLAALIAGAITMMAGAWNRGWEARLTLADKRTDLYLSQYRRFVELGWIAASYQKVVQGLAGGETRTTYRARIDELTERIERIKRQSSLAATAAVAADIISTMDEVVKERGGVEADAAAFEEKGDAALKLLRSEQERLDTLSDTVPDLGRMQYLASSLALALLHQAYWADSQRKPGSTDEEWARADKRADQATLQFLALTSREVRALRRSLPFRYLWANEALGHRLVLRKARRREGWQSQRKSLR